MHKSQLNNVLSMSLSILLTILNAQEPGKIQSLLFNIIGKKIELMIKVMDKVNNISNNLSCKEWYMYWLLFIEVLHYRSFKASILFNKINIMDVVELFFFLLLTI